MQYCLLLIFYYSVSIYSWSIFLLPLLYIFWIYNWYAKNEISTIVYPCVILSFIALFTIPPLFENDFYRYFFDGVQFLKSSSPYLISPEQSNFKELYPKVYSQIGFPDYQTVYPPLLVSFFSLLSYLSRYQFQDFLILLKLSSFITLLISFMKVSRLPKKETLFYFLHPLIIIEVFQNNHFDFLILALVLFYFSKFSLTKEISYAFITQLRFFYLPLVSMDKKFNIKVISKSLVLNLFITFFFFDQYILWFKNISLFSLEWEMNSGLFRLFRTTFFYFQKDPIFSLRASQFSCLFLLGVLWLTLKKLKLKSLHQAILFTHFFLLISPVVNPWYFVPLLGFIFYLKKPEQIYYHFSLAVLTTYYLFFLIPGQMQTEPGIWLDIEHILLWILWFMTFSKFKIQADFENFSSTSNK